MPARRRMAPRARRDQLLDCGAQMFASAPFHEVAMDAVADTAGVSRALLYRHFSSKRDLFAAIYQRAADHLVDASPIDPGRPLVEQVAEGLDAHIDYFVAHRHTVLAANIDLAGDTVVQAIIATELQVLRDRLVAAVSPTSGTSSLAAAVIMSWLVFVRTLSVEWLQRPLCSRTELRDVCTGALIGALTTITVT